MLLVDYIVDWARDIYRENIIRSLRSLASGDNDAASNLHTDTDIFSTWEVDHFDPSKISNEHQSPSEYNPGQKPFMALDSKMFVVRHASFIESRFQCVYATRNDVRTMLHLSERHMTHQLCRIVLDVMQNSVILNASTIETLEERWTGTVRKPTEDVQPDTKFFTAVGCSHYLSPTWHPIRELHILAIADDAWDAFVEFSMLKTKSKASRRPVYKSATASKIILEDIDKALHATTEATLLACLARRSVRFARCYNLNHPPKIREQMGDFLPCIDNGFLRAIVVYFHSSFQKENGAGQATFLRSSRTFGEQTNGNTEAQCGTSENSSSTSPGFHYNEPIRLSDGGAILVQAYSSTRDRDRSLADVCLYMVTGGTTPPTDQEAAQQIKQTYLTRDVYTTTRDNGPVNINRRTLAKWNLGRVYGLCFESERFLKLLKHLDASDLPARQGSPRVSDGVLSGRLLFKRNFTLWEDLLREGGMRVSSLRTTERLFLIYKVFSTEIAYWRNVATERRETGTPACSCCASVEHVALAETGLCEICTEVTQNTELPQWLRNSTLGVPAFQKVAGGGPQEYLSYFWRFTCNEWNDVLGYYPALDAPFDDISMLHSQCKEFAEWHASAVQQYEKRKRSDGPRFVPAAQTHSRPVRQPQQAAKPEIIVIPDD